MNPKDNPKINDTKIEANKLPFKCPVCSGFGSLKYGAIKCHGCDGKGFIVVSQEEVKNES